MIESLPLFHRIGGQPVIVLGEGPMAEPKRRLVKRAGGQVITDLAEGIDKGARLAFIAHQDAGMCESDAIRARCAGLLVNVVDRPDLCDFTTPSILDRNPVLVAVGTGGASAGLAKQLRLQLEAWLPADLGDLARKLSEMRGRIRQRWPKASDRRQALDAALTYGGPLDPLISGSVHQVEQWLGSDAAVDSAGIHTVELISNDPDDLTIRQLRLLGQADVILFDSVISTAVLDRARADAARHPLPFDETDLEGFVMKIFLKR